MSPRRDRPGRRQRPAARRAARAAVRGSGVCARRSSPRRPSGLPRSRPRPRQNTCPRSPRSRPRSSRAVQRCWSRARRSRVRGRARASCRAPRITRMQLDHHLASAGRRAGQRQNRRSSRPAHPTLPVAEEAARTAELMGNEVERLYDVGVAGLHRLLSERARLRCGARHHRRRRDGRRTARAWLPVS